MMPSEHTIEAKDGFPLTISQWSLPECSRIVLITTAMGVRRYFYHDFAEYLAQQGLGVITLDYRGIGGSRPVPLTDIDGDVTTWAKQDIGGCLQWITDNYPECTLCAVCHSLGGQVLGLVQEAGSLQKIVTIAASSGYWNLYPFPKNILFGFVWSVLYPLPTKILGYFPGRFLGLGENLPRNVALQISRWGRTPNYVGDYTNYKNIKAPILAYSFTDDRYCIKRGIDWIHDRYTKAKIIRRHVDPGQEGYGPIGHFGFFKDGRAPKLWNEVSEWLLEE